MIYAQLRIHPHKFLRDFKIQTDHLIPARRPDLVIVTKRKRTYQTVDFTVLGEHRIKIKENEKREKYLDLTRELKKLLTMKVTVIPIVIGALGMTPKG